MEAKRRRAEGRIITQFYMKEIVPGLELFKAILSSEDRKICIPRRVIRALNGYKIVCGNCGGQFESKNPLFVVFIQSMRKLDKIASVRKVFPQPKQCECGYVNFCRGMFTKT